MRDPSPEKPTPSPETWDTLEAKYVNLPADHQAALRADAVTRLVQQGHQRDFLIEPVILHDICCLLAAQDGCAAPVAPAASADVAPPPLPVPARPTPTPALGPPTLNNVIPADVQVRENLRRALELGRQAQDRGWIRWREPDRLYVVAAALHAVRCGKDNPCGLYRWLLEHPDQGSPMVAPDEPEAYALLKAYDYGIDPQHKAQPPPTSEPPALSKDAWCVHELQRELARQGVHSDVLEQLHREDPAYWTDEHCHAIARQLAHYKHALKQGTALRRLGELDSGEDWRASPFPEAVEPCPECGEEGEACLCPDVADLT